MLYDGIQLLGSSAASNFTIESGSTLPVSGNNLGELFYKLNDGLYVYNGSAWEAVASNATISIGGSNTQVQFNDSGSLAGSSLFTFNKTTGALHASSVTVNSDPTSALELATKQYVDNVASGLNIHNAVISATTGPIVATYDNGTSGVGATLSGSGTLPNIGGYTASVGDRILVKNQTDAKQNGVYNVTAVSPNFVLTRASDFDNSPVGEVQAGDFVYVQQGNIAGTSWVMTTAGTISFGTSNINWSQFSGQQATQPAGSNTQVQFNNSGSFGASSSLTFDSGTGTLSSTLFSGSGASLTDLNGSNISSGTVGTARLGSGSASSSTFLRGDGTWAVPTATSTSVSGTGYFGTYNATTGTYVGAHQTLNQPWLIQTNMNAGTNSKIYLTYVDSSGSLKIDLINDAGSSQSNFFKVDRSGTTATNITLAATAITLTGAVTGTSFSGSGASLTNLNASNLASGTVGTARLGTGTANSTTYLRGDGTWATPSASTATSLSATGTLPAFSTSTTSVTIGVNGATAAPQILFLNSGASVDNKTWFFNVANTGTLTLNTLNDANTAGNVPITLTRSGTTVSGITLAATAITLTGAVSGTSFSGDGSALTALNASNLASGTVGTARLGSGTANSTTYLRGDGTWAAPTATATTLSATASLTVNGATTGIFGYVTSSRPYFTFVNTNSPAGAQVSDFYVNNTDGSLNWRLVADGNGAAANWMTVTRSANTASNVTIAATAITLNGAVTGTSFSGSGTSLTNLNASNLASGTVGTARLGTGTADSTTFLRGDGTWATVSGASTSANNTWTAAQRGAVSALTYGATVTPNFDASNNFSLTATGNFTLANPTGTITPGQSGVIVITQDATGGRTISWGTYFKGTGGTKPTLSTAPNAVDIISYYVVSATQIFVTASLAIA